MNIEHLATSIQRAGFGSGVTIYGYFRDGLGTIYRSKPLRFDPERFIERDEPGSEE
jgi:hypothetical protein